NPLNDAPSFFKGPDQTVLANSGAATVFPWAASISRGGGPDEAGQQLTFNLNNDNPTLFSAQPAVDSTGQLTFTPANNQSGVANVTIALQDNGGSGGGNFDTSTAQFFKITVNKSGTGTNLVSSANPAFTNQVVTFTATVTSSTAIVGPPTG